MNIILKDIRAYDKHCKGSIETKKDIMIVYQIEGDPLKEFFHLFLTQLQARSFYQELGQQIMVNENTNVEG